MNRSLRILVADDEPDIREYFRKSLARLGHQVVGAARDGRELVELCRTLSPDLVITDVKMPELDGIEAALAINRERPVPVVLVSAHHDSGLLEAIPTDHTLGYLAKPIKHADLGPVIRLTMGRFEEFEAVRREAVDLSEALQARQLIESARGALVRRGAAGEEEAFRRLQELADQGNHKLVEAARILLADEATPSPGPN
jgi:response regulator NasT